MLNILFKVMMLRCIQQPPAITTRSRQLWVMAHPPGRKKIPQTHLAIESLAVGEVVLVTTSVGATERKPRI